MSKKKRLKNSLENLMLHLIKQVCNSTQIEFAHVWPYVVNSTVQILVYIQMGVIL